MCNEQARRCDLGLHEPGAGAPQEGTDGNAEQAEDDEYGFPRVRLVARHMDDVMVGRAQRQPHRAATKARAVGAHVAVAVRCHGADRHQRRAAHRRERLSRRQAIGIPSHGVDFEMQWRKLRQDAEHAVDRAEEAAPDPLVLATHQARRDGRDGGAAEDQQHRGGILVDADHLAVDRRESEGDEWPAAPAHPARNGALQAVAACRLGECSLRAHEAAPGAAHEHHGDEHEGPPDSPEHELRKQRHVVPDMIGALGQGQQDGHDDEHHIDRDQRPLQPRDETAVPQQEVAHGGHPHIHCRRLAARRIGDERDHQAAFAAGWLRAAQSRNATVLQ